MSVADQSHSVVSLLLPAPENMLLHGVAPYWRQCADSTGFRVAATVSARGDNLVERQVSIKHPTPACSQSPERKGASMTKLGCRLAQLADIGTTGSPVSLITDEVTLKAYACKGE